MDGNKTKKRKTIPFLFAVIIIEIIAWIVIPGSPICKIQAEHILAKKYQEDFTVTAVRKGLSYYTVEACSEDYPYLPFKASIEWRSKAISDSYVSKRVCDRISEQVMQNMGDGYYVFTEVMLGDTLLTDPEISLEDYLEEYPHSQFTIYLCAAEEECSISDIATDSKHMLENLPAINGAVVVYLADTEMMDYIQEYVATNTKTYTDFDRATEDAEIAKKDINDGYFSLTEYELNSAAAP